MGFAFLPLFATPASDISPWRRSPTAGVLFQSLAAALVCIASLGATRADQPLHARIDALLEAAHPAGQAALASDADFLRRAHLALTGMIPTAKDARAFFADPAPDKRARLIDQLLGS